MSGAVDCDTVGDMATRWLSDAEQTAWRRLIAVVQLLPHQLDIRMREHHGLTMHEYWVLAMLSESPGGALRMRELAKRSTVSPSRLSHTVSRLQERGWVTREQSTSDRRGQTATITAEGVRVVRETAPAHVSDVRQLVFDQLSPDQVAQLSAVCDQLLAELDPSGENSPGGRR